MKHFPVLVKNFPQPHLIFIRECPQNNITYIWGYFNGFPLNPFKHLWLPPPTPLPPPFHTHTRTNLFPNNLVIKDKEYCVNGKKTGRTYSLSSLLVSIYQSKHIEVFVKKIQLHEITKCLCQSVVVLQLPICLT